MDVNALTTAAVGTLMAVAWKIAGAMVLWLLGSIADCLRTPTAGPRLVAPGVR